MLLAKEDDPFIQEMLGGKATALTISRAAMQMASRKVAKAAIAGTLAGNDLDGLKKMLAELRAMESEELKLLKERGDLLPRQTVIEILSACVGLLTRGLDVLVNTIVMEVLLWFAREAFREASQEEKSRIVREFVLKTCNEVRKLSAGGVEKLIEERKEA